MLLHPVESSYLCAWLQAYATIVSASQAYGALHLGFWFRKALVILWVIDWIIAVTFTITLPLVHFVNHPHAQKEMPPSFMLLPTVVIYAATLGGAVLIDLPAYTGIWILWISYCLLGLGMLLSIFVSLLYSLPGFVYHLLP